MHCNLDLGALHPWELWRFTDEAHAAKFEHGYSRSGSLLVIAGGKPIFPLSISPNGRQHALDRDRLQTQEHLAKALGQEDLSSAQHCDHSGNQKTDFR